jgi:hypothetical protein
VKTNTYLYWILAAFFALVAVIYTLWSLLFASQALATVPAGGEGGQIEWVGAIGLTLCAILFAFIGFYVGKSHSSQGGELPEDRLDANIDDGDPELGHFSPWSWWPVALAGSAALLFLGVAIGFWIAFIGVALTVVALVGWVYEYYRGNFGR